MWSQVCCRQVGAVSPNFIPRRHGHVINSVARMVILAATLLFPEGLRESDRPGKQGRQKHLCAVRLAC